MGDMILKNDSRRESFKKKLSFFCTQFKNYHKMYHKIRKAQVKPTEKYKRNLENWDASDCQPLFERQCMNEESMWKVDGFLELLCGFKGYFIYAKH